MSGMRFTAWFAEGERSELRRLARRQGCSVNYLVRLAVRSLLFGEPVPAYLLADIRDNPRNDSNGGNGKNETASPAR